MNLSEIFEQIELTNKIVATLPDEPDKALSIISMVIDTWAAKYDRSSWEVWNNMYETARTVSRRMG